MRSPRRPCRHATVELEDGTIKHMSELVIGDRVLVEGGIYSPVFMFTHKLGDIQHEFVELDTEHTSIRLTDGHYLRVNGVQAAAGVVREGDRLTLKDGREVEVIAVRRVILAGLYNPQTTQGSIVVDGVVASCYTRAVQSGAAHALLAPLRAAFDRVGLVCRAFENGGGVFTHWMPSGTA